MTTEHETSRTLVKSPPELWAECSDAGSLARHLGEFGEITITRLDPETTVAWEGEHASGTVRIEPSGWGTRVTLTAKTRVEAPPPPEKIPEEPPEGESGADVEPLTAGGDSPPDGEARTSEEAHHATVEKTAADADPVRVDDTGRARARWRRITSRFRRREPEPSAGEGDLREALVSEEPDPVPKVIPEPDPVPEPDPLPESEPVPESEPIQESEPALRSGPEPGPDPAEVEPVPEVDAEAILASALESLGQAHHRPFSRS